MRIPAAALFSTVLAAALVGCSGGASTTAKTGSTGAGASGNTSTTSTATTSAAASSGSTTPAPSGTSSSSPSTADSCIDSLVARMTPEQRAGQLVMVGLDRSSSAESLDTMIAREHIGNMFFIGGWYGAANVARATAHVQSQVSPTSTGGVRFLTAADQEGGQVQQLRGAGFTRLPSALAQGAMSQGDRDRIAATIAGELKASGVNLDLAPVADTVPPDDPRANEPIGRWGRQYANDPAEAGAAVADVVRTIRAGGVGTTLKHFPGLGRVTGNTDFTSEGIVDHTTTADDAYLRPFADGIAAGAGAVMMSSAYYAKIDPAAQALYSPTVIGKVLRGQLGFTGVVISDDLNAVAVRGIPAGQRAVRFVRAGGDIALTGLAPTAPVMARALVAEAANDPKFAALIHAATKRVLTLKTTAGLTPCSVD